MSPKSQDEKCFLNMAGEFLVAGELNRRHIHCAVTYGTAKSADVWAFDPCSNRAVRVEVKTTGPGSRRWVIGDKPQKTAGNPDVFWVLVQLPEPHPHGASDDGTHGKHAPRFFVLSSKDILSILEDAGAEYRARYQEKWGEPFTKRGVPTTTVGKVQRFENGWDKIGERVGSVDAR